MPSGGGIVEAKEIHSIDFPPNCLDKGLPVRTWRLRGACANIRGPCQDKSDRVGWRHCLVVRQIGCRTTDEEILFCVQGVYINVFAKRLADKKSSKDAPSPGGSEPEQFHTSY